MKSGPRVVTFL